MDIRGIEVTNQLRSAIRAKLLELGVRYDEELPDYILVMVVNKKSRQQMHNDLHLFLESSTTPFVEWLHDQVLKKLQKVTVAKKKSLREFVPTVVVKQEEERKKKKISTTSFLEDQASDPAKEKLPTKPAAKSNGEKQVYKETLKSTSSQKLESSQKSSEKCAKVACKETGQAKPDSLSIEEQEVVPKRAVLPEEPSASGLKSTIVQEPVFKKLSDVQYGPKVISIQVQGVKRPLESFQSVLEHRESVDKRQLEAKRSKLEEEKQETLDESSKKLKSCVNKPKITSVVSVKNRLGLVSPRKKFEVYREKSEMEGRHRGSEKRRFEANRNGNFQRRNFEEDRSRRELKLLDPEKSSDIKTRLGTNKDSKEKITSTLKPKLVEKPVGTVKDRLGLTNVAKSSRQTSKLQDVPEFRSFKSMEQDRESNMNVKNRLGPLKNNFRPLNAKDSEEEEEDSLNLAEEDDSEETQQSGVNSGPIKSHIIAVNRGAVLKATKKRVKLPDRTVKDDCSDAEDNVDETKIPSKVIVTPRPLKPLQPAQKRATQSLLLRAVAEANQSVVTQTNPDPSLLEKKTAALKRCKVVPVGDVGQNLSVHLNASKRLVMEKIQVELNTSDAAKSESKPYIPQPITDEHMGVVMSLFQRSDNNQKFLVTLNGYNNNLAKEKSCSDDEEQLEMEVTEDDELALLATQAEPEAAMFRITDNEEDGDSGSKSRCEENNENHNTENVEKPEDSPRKRRKLSPIVYNRTHSPSPELKSNSVAATSVPAKNKKPLTENSLTSAPDKTKERCRYWPTCTLGSKCSYVHPPVMCSAFPSCKFGEKCAYKHPKCKFGLSCTKLGCIFSHRAQQQCKYHPFCTKPGCPYSHPATTATLGAESTSQRAKFTWRRRD